MPIPNDLIQSLQDVPGFDETSFKEVHESGEQVTAIRFHPAKQQCITDKWAGENIPWCPAGLYLQERPSFTLDPSFHAGAYYVQDASSMFLWHVLQQLVTETAGKKVLDLCAAPGGKSTLLASYFTEGLLVSNEVIKSRAAILVENMTKWGNDNVVVTNNDPAHFQSLGNYFDVIVVDAPCSGSGLFRKDPDAANEWSLDHVELCSQRQQRILSDILPVLKEEGILIYATCSYSKEEDEMIADWLVEEMGMESLPVQTGEKWGIIHSYSAKKQAAGYRFYPDKLKGEGFFIAVFKKTTSAAAGSYGKKVTIAKPAKQEMEQILSFIPLTNEYQVFKQADQFRIFKGRWMEDISMLAGSLYIRKAGVELGAIKGKNIVPSHELAVSLLPKDTFAQVGVNKEQALQYLRRQDISLQADKGWNLITYQNLPLGWIKALPNRINNYYPQEWRILKK
ncbi:MAG: methyltransferase RsmF C-terminal domain-like protein [Bacteroidota bacterium]